MSAERDYAERLMRAYWRQRPEGARMDDESWVPDTEIGRMLNALRATSPAERDPQALTDAEQIVTAWLDDDEALRIPDTPWGRSLYDAIRTLADLSARPAATTDTAAQALAQVRADLYSEDAQAVLHGVTGTHPDSYGGVTKDEALECAGELLTRLRAALDPGTRTAHRDTGHHGEGT